MLPFMIGAGLLVALCLVLAIPLRFVPRARRVPARLYWRRVLLAQLGVFPLGALVVTPAVFGYLVSRSLIDTRRDERRYEGPRIAADGSWLGQDRASLKREANGGSQLDPAVLEAARRRAVHFASADGTPLRGFFVPARHGEPSCSAVLVHGLVRGALEIEPVGRMFYDLGAEVFLLELRNHGGSGRAPVTFGLDESDDVVAAVEWLEARGDYGGWPIVLFGVSLGSAAVALAAPKLPDIGGIVLDSPMDRGLDTAHRVLDYGPPGRMRSLGVPQPFRSLLLTSLEFWSGFEFADIRPDLALSTLAPDVPVLVIGGGRDARMPPDTVRALFDCIPARDGLEELWIREGSDHGKIWIDDPDGYRSRLAKFVGRVVAPR